jgi:hypothetical protein
MKIIIVSNQSGCNCSGHYIYQFLCSCKVTLCGRDVCEWDKRREIREHLFFPVVQYWGDSWKLYMDCKTQIQRVSWTSWKGNLKYDFFFFDRLMFLKTNCCAVHECHSGSVTHINSFPCWRPMHCWKSTKKQYCYNIIMHSVNTFEYNGSVRVSPLDTLLHVCSQLYLISLSMLHWKDLSSLFLTYIHKIEKKRKPQILTSVYKGFSFFLIFLFLFIIINIMPVVLQTKFLFSAINSYHDLRSPKLNWLELSDFF